LPPGTPKTSAPLPSSGNHLYLGVSIPLSSKTPSTESAPKRLKNSPQNGGPKRHLNFIKVPKTKGSRAAGRELFAQEIRKRGPKNPYKQGLKNQKRDKHASCIGDGWLTVLDFEVLISLGFKIPGMQFFKKGKIRPLKTPKNRGPKKGSKVAQKLQKSPKTRGETPILFIEKTIARISN